MPTDSTESSDSLLDDLGDVPLSLIGAVAKVIVGGLAIGSVVFGLLSLVRLKR